MIRTLIFQIERHVKQLKGCFMRAGRLAVLMVCLFFQGVRVLIRQFSQSVCMLLFLFSQGVCMLFQETLVLCHLFLNLLKKVVDQRLGLDKFRFERLFC